MSLLFFLKPIYQDRGDPGITSAPVDTVKKKKKLTQKIVDLVSRTQKEITSKEILASRLAEQEQAAKEIQQKVWAKIQQRLEARIDAEQQLYLAAQAEADLKIAALHKKRKEEDEILLLLLKEII